jgi:hypothetical protein
MHNLKVADLTDLDAATAATYNKLLIYLCNAKTTIRENRTTPTDSNYCTLKTFHQLLDTATFWGAELAAV